MSGLCLAVTVTGDIVPDSLGNVCPIIAAYKKNLVAANLFSKMSFKGKKGDVLHIPKPTRGDAAVKTASSTAQVSEGKEPLGFSSRLR